jgi:hypothetical protein
MVKHLRKHGYEVTAFDLSSDSCAKVQAMGAALPSNAAGGFWHRSEPDSGSFFTGNVWNRTQARRFIPYRAKEAAIRR